MFGNCYRGRRVLVTGHTGFKGSWMTLWLDKLGAEIIGIALPPDTAPNHWDLLGLKLISERILDIRNSSEVANVVAETKPEIVFHLAAQPLVRRSYREPLSTWSTNVMGTANLLEACRKTPEVRAIVVVTTDKCYQNREWQRGYRENDRLGGHDPYSASKAACEMVVESYRKAFFHMAKAPLLASARAGNVIGGGDWSEDRLIPDLMRAISEAVPLEIRSPVARRPWQHVLECLSGYLQLGQRLLEGRHDFAESWNFGPEPQDNRTVAEVLMALKDRWAELKWHVTELPQPHEANLLNLDTTKVKTRLGWRPIWDLDAGLASTADWYRGFYSVGTVASRKQLDTYIADAIKARAPWAEA